MSEDRLLTLIDKITPELECRLNPGWRPYPTEVFVTDIPGGMMHGACVEITLKWRVFATEYPPPFQNPIYPNKEVPSE